MKKIEKFRKNNEFYIDIINKIEETKKIICKKNNGESFFKILKYIIKNEDFFIMAKKDRRKLNRSHLENYFKLFNKENRTIEETNTIIDDFFEYYYITYNLALKSENDILINLSNYKKKQYNKVLYLNYPYIFKKITDFLKNNNNYKPFISDIENTTLSIVMNSIIKFNNNKDIKFVTYLSYWIKYGIEEEVNYLNKNNQTKFNNLSNFRFSNSDFIDKNIKNEIKNSKDKEEILILKKKQKEQYKLNIKNLLELNMNFFDCFNINYKNLNLTTFVKNLNNILKNKENRDILYNFLIKEENINFFKSKQIEVNNNKTSLYKCLNLLLLNDFHHKTIPIFNIEEAGNDDMLSFEINYFEDDLYFKLGKKLNEEDNDILKKFYYQEIDEIPNYLKSKISNLMKKDENNNFYYLKGK